MGSTVIDVKPTSRNLTYNNGPNIILDMCCSRNCFWQHLCTCNLWCHYSKNSKLLRSKKNQSKSRRRRNTRKLLRAKRSLIFDHGPMAGSPFDNCFHVCFFLHLPKLLP